MRKIKYLAFSGGGAAGYAFSGALESLGQQKSFSFDKIKGVAGSSIGAIAALLVCLNYSPKEARQKFSRIDLNKFADEANFLKQGYRLLRFYGLYKGETLYQLILNLLQEKTNRKDPELITFADLKEMGFKDLYIIATKIYKKNRVSLAKQKVFSHEKTPHTSVAIALLASVAAPVYFAPVRLKKITKGTYVLNKDGDIFTDGGLLNNFPIEIFDSPKFLGLPDDPSVKQINPHTLGIALRNTEEIVTKQKPAIKTPIPNGKPIEYGKGIVNAFLYQYTQNNLDKAINRERTIQIDRLGVKLDDFGMRDATKTALINSAKKAVEEYFNEDLAPENKLIAIGRTGQRM